MAVFDDVKAYIEQNIFDTELWDSLDETKQRKAVNQAEQMLYRIYPRYSPTENPLPIDAIAYQTLWVIAIDDSIKRAEQGVNSIIVSGININLLQKDRSVAPEVLRILGRRVGRYGLRVEDTFRHRTNIDYARLY
jgi:hypothetical protein